jgi:hypothetical protein
VIINGNAYKHNPDKSLLYSNLLESRVNWEFKTGHFADFLVAPHQGPIQWGKSACPTPIQVPPISKEHPNLTERPKTACPTPFQVPGRRSGAGFGS